MQQNVLELSEIRHQFWTDLHLNSNGQTLADSNARTSGNRLNDFKHLKPPKEAAADSFTAEYYPPFNCQLLAALPRPGAETDILPILVQEANDRLREAYLKFDLRHQLANLPLKVSAEEEAEVQKTIHAKRSGQLAVAQVSRYFVKEADVKRLQPAGWLNDEIINFYCEMIRLRAASSSVDKDWQLLHHPSRISLVKKNIVVFDSFFFSKLQKGYETSRMARWTKNVSIFSKDLVLLPVNHEDHWTAACINFAEKRIESYDSLYRTNILHNKVFKVLRQYLDSEHRDKRHEGFDFKGWTDYKPLNPPMQTNGSDCGVFTCFTLEALSRGEQQLSFSQSDMPDFRRRMLWEIINGRFRGWH